MSHIQVFLTAKQSNTESVLVNIFDNLNFRTITDSSFLENYGKMFQEDKTDVYHIPKNEESHGHSFVLNPGHKYFLLVDTGTTWELSRELNTFWAEVLRELKGMSFARYNTLFRNKFYFSKIHGSMNATGHVQSK